MGQLIDLGSVGVAPHKRAYRKVITSFDFMKAV